MTMTGIKSYVGIWAILVTATILEVVTRTLPAASSLLVTIIILIAAGKAILIALYFQHLRYEAKELAILPIAGIVALTFLGITAFFALGM
jgi:cytochrome c oxidase subunit IV